MCVGISHIHSKHLIHRDLKTANIFLSGDNVFVLFSFLRNSFLFSIKIGDLGVATELNSSLSLASTSIGSLLYFNLFFYCF
jgi:NIMA (never in mitosis gene a)-related kinase